MDKDADNDGIDEHRDDDDDNDAPKVTQNSLEPIWVTKFPELNFSAIATFSPGPDTQAPAGTTPEPLSPQASPSSLRRRRLGLLILGTDGTEITTYDYSSRGKLPRVSLPDGDVIAYKRRHSGAGLKQ